ncbi:hypothetical protein ACLKA7_004597 [Drosophila subpalustris]
MNTYDADMDTRVTESRVMETGLWLDASLFLVRSIIGQIDVYVRLGTWNLEISAYGQDYAIDSVHFISQVGKVHAQQEAANSDRPTGINLANLRG